MIQSLITQPGPSLAALGIGATGIPMYRIWRKPMPHPERIVEVEAKP